MATEFDRIVGRESKRKEEGTGRKDGTRNRVIWEDFGVGGEGGGFARGFIERKKNDRDTRWHGYTGPSSNISAGRRVTYNKVFIA